MQSVKKNLTAIILCGGKGERLRPITNNLPKPLIEIKNKPILHYIIEHLKKYGIEQYIIAIQILKFIHIILKLIILFQDYYLQQNLF